MDHLFEEYDKGRLTRIEFVYAVLPITTPENVGTLMAWVHRYDLDLARTLEKYVDHARIDDTAIESLEREVGIAGVNGIRAISGWLAANIARSQGESPPGAAGRGNVVN